MASWSAAPKSFPSVPDGAGPTPPKGRLRPSPPVSASSGSARVFGEPTRVAANRSVPPANSARKYTKDTGEVKKTSYTRDRIPLLKPKKARMRPTSRPCRL